MSAAKKGRRVSFTTKEGKRVSFMTKVKPRKTEAGRIAWGEP